jgi:hypothetical protein
LAPEAFQRLNPVPGHPYRKRIGAAAQALVEDEPYLAIVIH